MYNVERKEIIIGKLEKDGKVDVRSLSERFGSSRETVRRDLCNLEREGIITRTHGGAVLNKKYVNAGIHSPVEIRSMQRYSEKNAICRCAASLIENDDVIFVDNSSTTIYLIQYIPQNIRVNIITNSVKVLTEIAKVANPNLHCMCLGGDFKESNYSFYGSVTLKNAEAYYPCKAFMSCTGIRADGLITDSSLQEADTKRMMIEQSREVYLLVDYTKFSSNGQVFLANMFSGCNIITDSQTTEQELAPLRRIGAKVIFADGGETQEP